MVYESIKRNVIPYVAPRIKTVLEKITESDCEKICEIRMGRNMPLSLSLYDSAAFLSNGGSLLKNHVNAFFTSDDDFERTLELMTGGSVYAAVEELKNGFITLRGGFRVGICGRAVLNGGSVSYIKEISFLNIRIAREIFGCASELSKLITANGRVKSTLVIGPPHSGKTTLIRDLARILSNEYFMRTAIADERGEIAAMHCGKALCDVGLFTAVMDLCPKKIALNMLVRSMSPDVIITDELGGEEDLNAVKKAVLSGVGIVATVHGGDFDDAAEFLPFFECAVLLSRENIGKIQKILKNGE